MNTIKLKNKNDKLTIKLRSKASVENPYALWYAILPGQVTEVPSDLDWKKQYRELCSIYPAFELDGLTETTESVTIPKSQVPAGTDVEPEEELEEPKKRGRKKLF